MSVSLLIDVYSRRKSPYLESNKQRKAFSPIHQSRHKPLGISSHDVYGGFIPSLYQAFLSDAGLFDMLAKMVAEYLPVDRRNSILSDMGLNALVPKNIHVYEENKSPDFYELFI